MKSHSFRTTRDCLTAAKLYVSPVFIRENPAFLISALYYVLTLGIALTIRHRHAWHDGHYAIPASLGFIWWFVISSAVLATNIHYWRQIRPTTTYLLSRLQKAEYHAIHLVTACLLLLLAVPPVLTGAPLLNCLAIEAIALLLWTDPGSLERASLLSARRAPRTLVKLIGFFVLLVPKWQNALFSAPWFVALAICLLCLNMVMHALRVTNDKYTPTPSQIVRRKPPGFLKAPLRSLGTFIMWQPSWMVRLPLTDPILSGFPIATAILVVVMSLSLSGIAELITWLSDGVVPSVAAFRHHLAPSTRHSLLIIAIGVSAWMRQRGDWPFLFTLGPHGEKLAFARTAFRLHLQRVLQAELIAGTFLGTTSWIGGEKPFVSALISGLSSALMVVGFSFTPAIAFLISRLNRPSIISLVTVTVAIFGVQLTTSLMMESQVWWRWLLPPAVLLLAAPIYHLIPGRLAKQDWPIEPLR